MDDITRFTASSEAAQTGEHLVSPSVGLAPMPSPKPKAHHWVMSYKVGCPPKMSMMESLPAVPT